eukprot:superscaffoldBa00004481_g18948
MRKYHPCKHPVTHQHLNLKLSYSHHGPRTAPQRFGRGLVRRPGVPRHPIFPAASPVLLGFPHPGLLALILRQRQYRRALDPLRLQGKVPYSASEGSYSFPTLTPASLEIPEPTQEEQPPRAALSSPPVYRLLLGPKHVQLLQLQIPPHLFILWGSPHQSHMPTQPDKATAVVSPIGVATRKYSGKKRLIIDLSSPHGSTVPSINSLIPSLDFSMQYATIDHAISLIRLAGQGAWLSKADIPSPVLPIHLDY